MSSRKFLIGPLMEDSSFQRYSRTHVHFYDEKISILLAQGLALINGIVQKPNIADLGCGDGRLFFALYEKGLLKNVGEIVGVDISRKRVERLATELPFIKGFISDALNVKNLLDSSFDYVICSQLVEHVKNDYRLVQEVRRLLRKGGLAYISSVVKKSYGIYFYFKDGSFKLDPTHVKEYSSVNEFLSLIKGKGFEVIDVETRQVMFPLLDLVLRLFIKIGFLEPNVKFYQQHKILGEIRRLRIPVIGYKTIEALVKKNE